MVFGCWTITKNSLHAFKILGEALGLRPILTILNHDLGWREWQRNVNFKCFADHVSRGIDVSFHINLRYSLKMLWKVAVDSGNWGQQRKGNRYYKKNHIKKTCNVHKAWNKKAQSSDVEIPDAVVQWIRTWFLGISSVNIEFNFRLNVYMSASHLATIGQQKYRSTQVP